MRKIVIKNKSKGLVLAILLIQTPLSAEWWQDLEHLYKNTFGEKNISYECSFKKREDDLQNRWKGFVDLSDKAIGKINKLETVNLEKSWVPFVDTKESLNGDINKILNDLLIALSGDTRVIECLDKMREINRKIISERDSLTKIQERTLSSELSESDRNESTMIFAKIESLNKRVEEIRSNIIVELKNIGLTMEESDLEKLLMRIDSEDIVQVMVVFDISKKITSKLEDLIKNDSDNIKLAKRYYGMNLVLSKIALHVQDRYKTSLITKYIPKLEGMVQNLNNLLIETETFLKESKTKYEREIYTNNIKAQKLSIETANLYLKNLEQQLKQVDSGREQALNNLKLTSNSYKTLQAGVGLLDVIKETQNSFSSIMKIQLPEIIPFKNDQMKLEFHKITEELRDQ
jgi:hypothetical protein